MNALPNELVFKGFRTLLRELLFGPSGDEIWIINREDKGLIGQLRALSAAQASRELIPGRASIAGHANHVVFHLGLLNRALRGENSFAGADWAGSWKTGVMTEERWQAVLSDIERQTDTWLSVLEKELDWDPLGLTGTFAGLAHVAYHFGAVRQLVGLLQG